MENLPIVGVQAVVAGARQFVVDAKSVIDAIRGVNAAAQAVANTNVAAALLPSQQESARVTENITRAQEAAATRLRRAESDWQFRLESIRLNGVQSEQTAAQNAATKTAKLKSDWEYFLENLRLHGITAEQAAEQAAATKTGKTKSDWEYFLENLRLKGVTAEQAAEASAAAKSAKNKSDWEFFLESLRLKGTATEQQAEIAAAAKAAKNKSDWEFYLENIRLKGIATERAAAQKAAEQVARDKQKAEDTYQEQQRRDDVATIRAKEQAEAKAARTKEVADKKARKDEEDWQFRLANISLRAGTGGRPPTISSVSGGGGGGLGGAGRALAGGAGSFGVGSAAAAAAVGIGLVHIAEGLTRIGVEAVKSQAAFEHFLQPAIVLTDATVRQTDELSLSTLELSRNVELSANNIAQLTTELAKEGLTLQQINDGAATAARNLEVLSAGELSAAGAANIISKALQAYHLAGTDAARVTQAVAGAAQRSAGNFGDYELALKRLTPVAGLLKIPIEEVTTAIALLNNAGLQGEQVGSNLLQLFLRLIHPTKESAAIMHDYGVNIFDTNGKFIGLGNTFKVLDRAFSDQAIKTKGLTEAERDQDLATLGMSRSFLAALAIINQGPDAFDETLNSIKSFDTDAAVKQFGTTLIGQVKIMQNNVFALGRVFSEDLSDHVKAGITAVNEAIQSLNLIQTRGIGRGLIENIIGTALPVVEQTIRTLAPAFAVLAENVSKVFQAAGGWSTVSAAFEGLLGWINAAQEGLAIFIAGFGELIGHLPEFTTAAAGAAEGFITVVSGAFDAVLKVATDVVNTILEYVNQLLGAFGTDLPSALKFAGQFFVTLAAVGVTAVTLIIKALQFLGQIAVQTFQGVISVVGPFVKAIINNVIQDIQGLIEAFKVVGQFIIDVFTTNVLPVIQQVFRFIITDIVPPVREAFATIGTVFGAVIGFIKDRIIDFLQFASQIPIVGKYFQAAENFVNNAATAIDGFLVDINKRFGEVTEGGNSLGDFFRTLPNLVLQGISGIADEVASTFQSSFEFVQNFIAGLGSLGADVGGIFDHVKASLQGALPDLENWITRLHAIAATAKEVRDAHQGWTGAGQVNAAPTRGAPIPELAPVAEGSSSDKFLKHVKDLLRDVPQVNDELAKYVASLTEADRDRLGPIVDALRAQIPLIRQIMEAKKELLNTEIAIEQSNERIAAIDLQIQRLDLQSKAATLPLDGAILALKGQGLAIQQKLLPIENAIADIDKQIAIAQRENYDQIRARLELQLQALPLENKIADIDKQIALVQRENLQLTQQRLLIQQEMLPIQDQIDEQQKRINALHREDYALTRQRLQLELQRLPFEQAIANIDRQIQDLQREDYDLTGRRLDLQQQMLGTQNAIADIDRVLNDLQRTNYDMVRQKAELELAALPHRQRVADIEEQIANSIDKQRELSLKRDELIAQRSITVTQRQLDDVEKQLNDLWARFNLQPNSAASAALVPQIVGLEQQRTQLENILKPAQDALTDIQRKQEDITFENNLTVNALEQQKLAEEAILKPINDRIEALDRELEITQARNAVVIAGLEQQKQHLQDILDPLQFQITQIDRIREASTLATDVTVNGLNKQKQLLQDLARPYDDQLHRLDEIQQVTQITNQISETFLQEELQRLRDILQPMQDRLDAINREKAAQDLRNQIVINGLNQEKQLYQDLLLPIQNQIDAIDRDRAAHDLRTQIVVAGLNKQKQGLNDLAQPMRDQLDAIQRQIDAITIQRDITTNAYDQMKNKLEILKNSEELYKNSLEAIRVAEQKRLDDLISKYQDALVKSGAFTVQEAADAITRQGLWGDETSKVNDLKTKIDALNVALGTTAGGFRPLPTDISNTNTSFGDLITKIGNGGSGVIKSLNDLNTAVGSTPTSGVNNALGLLDTSMKNITTSTGHVEGNLGDINGVISQLNLMLTTALVGINARPILDVLNDLNARFGTLRDNVAAASGVNDNRGIRDLISVLNTLASNINNNSYGNALINLMNDFGGGADSLAYKVTVAWQAVKDLQTGDRGLDALWYNINNTYRPAVSALKDSFNDLATAINDSKSAIGSLNATSAKYFATLGAAVGIGVGMFAENRKLGLNLTDASHFTYLSILDRITHGDIGFAEGGIVPGAYNQAQWAIVHGGERIIPTSAGVTEPTRVSTGQVVNNYNSIINNYNFQANYERVQDPITLSADVRSIIEMSRR